MIIDTVKLLLKDANYLITWKLNILNGNYKDKRLKIMYTL